MNWRCIKIQHIFFFWYFYILFIILLIRFGRFCHNVRVENFRSPLPFYHLGRLDLQVSIYQSWSNTRKLNKCREIKNLEQSELKWILIKLETMKDNFYKFPIFFIFINKCLHLFFFSSFHFYEILFSTILFISENKSNISLP